ncbi:MAG: dynamin family protein, partial [Pseudomonadota bacterium]
MKTNISGFCTEFSEALFPLAESLGDTVSTLESLAELPPEGLGEGFSNTRHRLEALVNKVQGQEAYVLLFGPLKSGKSTLINAISGGYVSEVTSLPAYPCMVYLKYGPAPAYSVIRYSGKREELDSSDALMELLKTGHRTLSDRIRAIEEFGEEFDPAVHLPSAIRRVFVELPVENLRESGTVLVDTPGLYSKMKFGYDYMTQEFRDSAACAVFVVKADSLFLEQVFSDFNDLLDQFSRVFVVVNIDTGKQDLLPDGSLEPSLESRDPDEVVKAFEVLSMSAPLRQAADTGRLHIYPVDLRSAASQRLREGTEEPTDHRFDAFLSDLMGYLNSNDYLQEFISDTLRQAKGQCDEIDRLCGAGVAEQLDPVRQSTDAELKAKRDCRVANEALQPIDWTHLLAPAAESANHACAESSQRILAGLGEEARQILDEWMQSDDSLQQLRDLLTTAVKTAAEAFRDSAARGLGQVRAAALEAVELDAARTLSLSTAGLNVKQLLDAAASQLQVPDA